MRNRGYIKYRTHPYFDLDNSPARKQASTRIKHLHPTINKQNEALSPLRGYLRLHGLGDAGCAARRCQSCYRTPPIFFLTFIDLLFPPSLPPALSKSNPNTPSANEIRTHAGSTSRRRLPHRRRQAMRPQARPSTQGIHNSYLLED